MTKKIKATTNKLTLWYNNDTSYTIPRVSNFELSADGKYVTGMYNKTAKEHSITQHHNISFTIELTDVTEISYEGRYGETSKSFQVSNGRVSSVTEYRNEEDYYKPVNRVKIDTGNIMLTPFVSNRINIL
jgi:hypothetical protein